ncbi:MAG TPA: ABC transporter permease [Aggregatilineaceae bacterium]|nr:ABC transporter permease [Aggregatilineaceae bacterium]
MSVFLSAVNPVRITRSLWHYRSLIVELVKRELSQRYRGSFLGALWSYIVPLFMLLIYTFVFGVIFKTRWTTDGADTPTTEFALILFAGLTPFNLFSETANRSPTVIVNMTTYVKKVVFPLEILPVVTVGAALINSFINVGLLLVANLIIMHSVSWTLIFLPLAYIPLLLFCLGVSWFLSSLGVYIRDVANGIVIVVQILFFLTPIVYPSTSVPAALQPVLAINPLTFFADSFRQSVLWTEQLHWKALLAWIVVMGLFAVAGYAWFMRTRKGFADVL